MFRGLFVYYDRETWLHRAHPLAKLAMCVSTSAVALAAPTVVSILAVALLLLGLLVSVRLPRSRLFPLARLVVVLVALTTLSQAVFYYEYYVRGAGTVLVVLVPKDIPVLRELTLGRGVVVTLEGIIYGALIGLKFAVVIVVSQVVVMTTSLTEFIAVMRRLRFPSKLAFLLLAGMRLVPVALEELFRIRVVLRMKTSRRCALLHPLLAAKCLVRELVVRAAMLAVALELRCPKFEFPAPSKSYSRLCTLAVLALTLLSPTLLLL